ncbi:hypothetical protein BH11ACT3_BH11ACT3_08340 [soil metagenome]
MLGNLTGWHFLIVLAIILLLFGATKLPALAKSVGQSAKVLRNELKDDDKKPGASDATIVDSAVAPASAPASTDTAADKK